MNDFIEKLRKTLLSKYSPKQHNKVANGIMFVGVIINTFEILKNPTGFNWPISILAIVLVVFGAFYQALIVRCPVCGDKLKGKASKMMDRCPNCNHDLDKVGDK